MKKLFFIAVAAISLVFAACSENKSDEASAVIENLKAQIEAGDASALQSTLQSIQAKVAEIVAKDPEAAKTYVAKIQEFVKENKEKITAVIGDNAVAQGVVSALVDAPAETVVSTLTAGQSVLNNAQEAAEGVKDSLNQAVNDQIDAAKEKVGEEIDKAAEKANEKVNEAAAEAMKSLGL